MRFFHWHHYTREYRGGRFIQTFWWWHSAVIQIGDYQFDFVWWPWRKIED